MVQPNEAAAVWPMWAGSWGGERLRACGGMWLKAKELSGSLPLQICQEVYKNVIVSQLLVIIFPFTMAAGNMYVYI